ncbi:MAG: histidinol dehydrogenase [Promethearchaeota archaeon]
MIFINSIRIVKSEVINEINISEFIPRNFLQINSIKETILGIIEGVKKKGDKAILEFTKKYDGVELVESELKVTPEEISNAYNKIDKNLLKALEYAKMNLIKFHRAQIREDWMIKIEKGVKAGQVYRPLERIGIYIPGGRAIYPSTVLMTATPAYVAGVKEIILCSPPQINKKIAPEIIVAASEFNINNIYKIGGAQAIAAMALGTNTIPKVQKIIGPGNKWVNAAKQILSNIVAIDTPAGPSEILIIADNSSDYNLVIVDLLSQIEHDIDNIGIIVSTSTDLIDNIINNIESYVDKSERKDIIKSALKNNSLIIEAKDLEDCVRICNLIAPEHLEIMTKNPKAIVPKIMNAGAIFIGPNTPVSLGDYSAGTNHVLPTGGNAVNYSGLNSYDFLKIIDVLECDLDGLRALSKSSSIIADFEGLPAHKKSIEKRLKKSNNFY